jgi:hypothetical protein
LIDEEVPVLGKRRRRTDRDIGDCGPARRPPSFVKRTGTSEENIMNEMQKEHSKFVCFLFFSVMNDWIVLVIVPTILLLTLRF